MRLSLFVSAVLATSLFAGGALADRPGDDSGGRTNRVPVREMRIKEVRETTKDTARPHETPQTRVKDNQVTDRFRNRGDIVDRNAAGPATKTTKGSAAGYNIKSQRTAEKALERMNSRKANAINCSATDDNCGQSSRAAAAGAKAGTGQGQGQTKASQTHTQNGTNDVNEKQVAREKHNAAVQKKRDELREQQLMEKLYKNMCQRKAQTCHDEK